MSNFFDNLTSRANIDALKNSARDALSGLGGVGESVKNGLGKDNMGGMLGAGALGGLLGALLGRGGKDLAGTVLALGGTAAVGSLAWSFYKKWSQESGRQGASAGSQPTYADPERAVERAVQESPDAARPEDGRVDDPATARLLLQAMVYAARADGHIDDAERARINDALRDMFPNRNLSALMDQLMQEPIDPRALAEQVHSQEQAHDLYRLSCAIVEPDQFMERSYLDGLADALHIPAAVKEKIEKEAELTRRQTQG